MTSQRRSKRVAKKRQVKTSVASAPVTRRAFVSGVKSVLQNDAEIKYQSSLQVNQAVDDTPTIYSAGAVGQGTTNITRLGNVIQCKGFHLRANYRSVVSASVRQIIFVCEADATGMPTITLANILLDTTNPVVSMYNPNYVSNNMNSDRPFKILSDKHLVLAPATPAYNAGVPGGQSFCNGYMNTFIPYRRKIVYSGSGSALADMNKNTLFYMFISDNTTGTEADFDHILYFTDA